MRGKPIVYFVAGVVVALVLQGAAPSALSQSPMRYDFPKGLPQTPAAAKAAGYNELHPCDTVEGIPYINPKVIEADQKGLVSGAPTLHYDATGKLIGVIVVLKGSEKGPELPLLGKPDKHPGPPYWHYHVNIFWAKPRC
jgi:hypothetical protein